MKLNLLVSGKHSGYIYALNFSDDSKYFITVSADGTVRIWDQNGIEKLTLDLYPARVVDAGFDPEGNYIVA